MTATLQDLVFLKDQFENELETADETRRPTIKEKLKIVSSAIVGFET